MDKNIFKGTIAIFILIILIITSGAYEKNVSLSNELDYKNKIITQEFTRNFESYEEYCLWKAEKIVKENKNGNN